MKENPIADGSFDEALAGDTTKLTKWVDDLFDKGIIVEIQAPKSRTIDDPKSEVTKHPISTQTT